MSGAADAPDILVRLPDDQRHAFKDPLGELYTDADALIADAGSPVIAVGDVVTATLVAAGHTPDVAIVDGHTEREPVDDDVRRWTDTLDHGVSVANPAATVTRELTAAIVAALADPHAVRIEVDGEEDLAVVPAVLAAPIGATVVYGQPGEGMVALSVTDASVDRTVGLLERFTGAQDVVLAIVGRRSG